MLLLLSAASAHNRICSVDVDGAIKRGVQYEQGLEVRVLVRAPLSYSCTAYKYEYCCRVRRTVVLALMYSYGDAVRASSGCSSRIPVDSHVDLFLFTSPPQVEKFRRVQNFRLEPFIHSWLSLPWLAPVPGRTKLRYGEGSREPSKAPCRMRAMFSRACTAGHALGGNAAQLERVASA